MLTPEQARDALVTFEKKHWKAKLLARLALHPIGAFKLMSAMFESDDVLTRLAIPHDEKSVLLDEATPKTRRKLFDAMFPNMGEYVQAAWDQGYGQPYLRSWVRRPFRAPNHPRVSLGTRVSWLTEIARALCPYDGDIEWLAQWAPHLSVYSHPSMFGKLLAAAIDSKSATGERVFEILCQSSRGEHEIGRMGSHVVVAMLTSARPEAWELMEKMLLAAQREEGLRQSILESVDMAHPEAFRRMLRLILEHDLVRFSSVVRAMDVWLGFQWDSASAGVVKKSLASLLELLENENTRDDAIDRGSPEQCYLGLWAHGFYDVSVAVPKAIQLLTHEDAERRYAAVEFLSQSQLTNGQFALIPALNDEDERVVARVLPALNDLELEKAAKPEVFDLLSNLARRLPKKKKKLPSILWPWATFTLERTSASRLFNKAICGTTIDRVESHLEFLTPAVRGKVAQFLGAYPKSGNRCRSLLFKLVSDASADVRSSAFEALKILKIGADEAPQIEALLSRKPSDLRRAAIGLLCSQDDGAALASTERLLASNDELQRAAGEELVTLLQKEERASKKVAALLEKYAASSRADKNGADEQLHSSVEIPQDSSWTLENYLGLLDPHMKRTPPAKPRAHNVVLVTDAAIACLHSLDDLIYEHRETEFTIEEHDGSKKKALLADNDWRIPFVPRTAPVDESLRELPLSQLWEEWWENRSDDLRDDDGFELIRAMGIEEEIESPYRIEVHNPLKRLISRKHSSPEIARRKLRYKYSVTNITHWLTALHPPANHSSFILDAVETSYASVPQSNLTYSLNVNEYRRVQWRESYGSPYGKWLSLAELMSQWCRYHWSTDDHVRLWRLLRWLDEPGGNFPRRRPAWNLFFSAYRVRAANKSDFLDLVIGPRPSTQYYGQDFNQLRYFTSQRIPAELAEFPELVALVNEVRERAIAIELGRGETPTEVSGAVLRISCIRGIERLIRILKKFGNGDLKRGWLTREESRDGAFSHMIRVSYPDDDDTPEKFKELTIKESISEKRLLELAVFVPHWARFVETTVEWKGLTEAAWWLHAHTKDERWQIDQETRDEWAAEMNRRTPLSHKDLVDGAVDVDWFQRAFGSLGRERWAKLFALAKFASSGTGHARAVLFANAMQSKLSRDDLMARVNEKRNKDAARALGLLPLADGKARRLDLIERYELLQEFLRTSRKFGSQRRASEKRAVEIGLENLARTAGFPDPLRLQWAMEIESLRDLASGPVTAVEGDVTVQLSIDEDGSPDLTALKKGKPLKAISSALKKKSEAVAELCDRKTHLRRQRSRIRISLEEAMCRGDEFAGGELVELMGHPMLAPSLRRLIMLSGNRLGYPSDDGTTLRHHSGEAHQVTSNDPVRIAHAFDLFESEDWHFWQKECFSAERIQPFKQVFRELYILTEAEKQDRTESVRYAGHQVNPRQAIATLGSRGWTHHSSDGVTRTYHKHDITARVDFDQYFTTPADVEGLTVHSVHFSSRGEWKPIDLKKVPPRVFSETMRDIDLMVSVTHRGGVDPEATTSTVEMRAALVRETCTFLEFSNVRFNSSHVLIDGQIGNYSVHLGSGVVHRMPGGMLCIVPVHAHHRGRLFLPFADEDPKTSEVLSKVLLLADDSKIKDPTILDQLRAR